MLLINFFEMYPAAFIISMGILGLMIGSFINVVIYRLPIMMERDWRAQCQTLFGIPESTGTTPDEPYNIIVPRSRCPHCQYTIRAIHNIPVFSFLFLGGKCYNCKRAISVRYPLIEFTCAVLTAFIAWYFGLKIETLFAVLLTWSLLCLSMIDIDHQLLPDDITLPLLWLGLGCNLFNLFTDIQSSLIGAMLGYGILWTIFIGFKLLTGKEGMGYGDFKLLAMLGAWMGWQMLPLIILLSSLLGAAVGISLILSGKQGRSVPIPFGPYLALSGWIALIWGQEINAAYLGFL